MQECMDEWFLSAHPISQPSFPLKSSLLFSLAGKRGADGRLSSAQAALMLQEETARKAERAQQALADQVAGLERNLHICQEKNRELQVSRNPLPGGERHSVTCHGAAPS